MLSGLRCQNCVARVRLGPRHDEPGRGRATDTTVSGAQCESNSGHDNSVQRLILCSYQRDIGQYWTVWTWKQKYLEAIANNTNMERNSPLLQAVRSSYDDMEYVVDEVRDNIKTGDITAVMSYDQMSHLLTLMVTISVISILILIFSVTVILGFLW